MGVAGWGRPRVGVAGWDRAGWQGGVEPGWGYQAGIELCLVSVGVAGWG